jgi:hypothetical protein
MGKRPIILATVLGIAFALATLGVLVMQMSRQAGFSCRVCMQYQGRVECREALGATEEEALRTAKDNACSLITAGMTQVVECTTRTQPMSMSCE